MSDIKNKGSALLIAIAGLGGFLYGVDFGVIAAAEPYMKAMGVYSEGQISHIVGAVLLGGILSSLTAGMLAEWFGRKRMIVASAVMFLVAIPIVSLSLGSFPLLYAGRVLQGMSAGYMAVIMPMYLTETLPPAIRGRGTGVFQFCLGLGLVVAAGAGCLVATWYGASDKADEVGRVAAWGANFWWTMLPVAVLFFGSLRLPESPVWLKKRKEDKGLRTKDKGESSSILSLTSSVVCPPNAQPRSLLQRRYVLPFLLAVLVLTFNKTTGMSSFTSYLVTILHSAGFEGIFANWGQFAVKLTNMLHDSGGGARRQEGAHVAPEGRHRRHDGGPRRDRIVVPRDRALWRAGEQLHGAPDALRVLLHAGVLRIGAGALRVARPLRADAAQDPRERHGDRAFHEPASRVGPRLLVPPVGGGVGVVLDVLLLRRERRLVLCHVLLHPRDEGQVA